MRMLRVGLYAIVILLLVACDRAHQVSHGNKITWLNRCPDFSVTGKAPVEQNAECGIYSVKENPQDSNSMVISLNVLRLPAVNPVPEKDPLFIIAGGPGQSAVVVAETLHNTFNDVRKNRDIIFVDQRGTGKSNALECEFETAESKQLSPAQQDEFGRKAIKHCIEKYKEHFAFYTTPYAVADLDVIRAALGYEKINIWGGSYGSRVVLEYLRRFPAHTRTGIVDGVAPASIALPWFMESDGLAALIAINKQCEQTPICATRYGDIVQKAQKVSDELLKKPIAIVIPHPHTHEKITVNITAQDFSSVIHLALYSRELSSLLPQVVSTAEAGDYQLFAALSYMAKSKSDLMGISYGMHYAVVCNEDYPLYKDKDVTPSNVFLHSDMVQKYSEVCAQFSPGNVPADYWEPVKSDAPVLILSGAVDPVTPPHWGDLVKSTLPNATHIIAPGGHHIISQEGCIAQLIAAFIAKGDASTLDTQCVNHIQPLAIHIPASVPEQEIKSASSEPKEINHDSH